MSTVIRNKKHISHVGASASNVGASASSPGMSLRSSTWPLLSTTSASTTWVPNGSAVTIKTSSGQQLILDDSIFQYFDLIASLLGIEIGYQEFSRLSLSERLNFLNRIKRDISINKILS